MQRMQASMDRLQEKYVGKTIRINNMVGEPQYTGKTGVVEFVDGECQLHGTWGGLAVQLEHDSISIIEKENN